MDFALVIVVAYLLGALPFAVWISRAFGLSDPRDFGSGNPGATNVARSGNKTAAALTLIADYGKGALAVALLGDTPALMATAGVAVVVGHLFSIFLRFRGGKGVATLLGVMLLWHWQTAIIALVVWGCIFIIFRVSAVASISAMLIAAAIFARALAFPFSAIAAALCALVIIRHHRNIRDLWRQRRLAATDSQTATHNKMPSLLIRSVISILTVAGLITIIAAIHDYPQTRRQINLFRIGDIETIRRPWIPTFYFINEIGNGIKFTITGNEKYMRSYPSSSYLLNKKIAGANANNWRDAIYLAGAYYKGKGVAVNKEQAIFWLRQARHTAPEEAYDDIDNAIIKISLEVSP